ncbi:MAG: DUF2726 domain-containing protein [Candidatus Sumerlaeia bacterium]|nr:DUF2726 domain-containing protein [Candidatus Sumerlaeia bacterium]
MPSYLLPGSTLNAFSLDAFGDITQIFAVLGVVVLAIIILAFYLLRTSGKKPIFPYKPKAALSPAEKHFYNALATATPGDTVLLSKVRLADFLEVTSEAGEHRLAFFGRISQKHADFLLIDGETSLPLVVIELDDNSHKNNQRTIESDRFKNSTYAAAGVTILRFPVQKNYDPASLGASLAQGISDCRARSATGG